MITLSREPSEKSEEEKKYKSIGFHLMDTMLKTDIFGSWKGY